MGIPGYTLITKDQDGGEGRGSEEFWDRKTMFSQLTKRSIRGQRYLKGGGIFSRDFNFGFERHVSLFPAGKTCSQYEKART